MPLLPIASSKPAKPAILLEGLLVFAIVLLVYLLLRRPGFYEVDGQSLVHWLAVGKGNHDRHMLFLPVARLLAAPLLASGLTPFEALRAVSAIGMSLSVLLFWAAALRLGRIRTDRLLMATAIAVSPALLFFATIVEFHGLFMAFAGLAWFFEACLERSRRSWPWAVSMGISTGLAALVHATGQLLGPLLPLFYLARSRDRSLPLRPALRHAAQSLGCHVGVVLLIALWMRSSGTQGQEDYILSFLTSLPPLAELFSDLWFEWFLAFLPVSLLCWCAFRDPARRLQTLWLLVSVLGYVLMSWVLVPGMYERGAYLLPLVYPAARLALSVRLRWLWILMTLAGLFYGIHDLGTYPYSTGSAAWAGALHEFETEQPGFYLLGDRSEIDALLIHEPKLPYGLFEDTVTLVRQGKLDARTVTLLLSGIVTAEEKEGRTVYLDVAARRLLELQDPRVVATRKALDAAFRMDLVERGGIRVWRLRVR